MPVHHIQEDQKYWEKVLRGQIKKGMPRYLANPERIIRQEPDGKYKFVVPIYRLDIPKFRFKDIWAGGVGQGDGNEGDPLSPDESGGQGGMAGNKPRDHIIEHEVSLEEFADIIAEDLDLPNLNKGGKKFAVHARDRYTGIRKTGPESLRDLRRTYKQALRRSVASGIYDPKKPLILPIREDTRYRSPVPVPVIEESAQTAIIYIRDYSGSMGEERKMMSWICSFWISLWICRNFPYVEERFIVHDTEAKEVDKNEFFSLTTNGGTKISSAYQFCSDMIQTDYPDGWNIFVVHFSDGENEGDGDDRESIRILKEGILPASNMFGYIQVESEREKPEKFQRFLQNQRYFMVNDFSEKVIVTAMKTRVDTRMALKDLFGKRK